MIPRPYQARLVSSAIEALQKKRNTLAIAATGSGKTIMLSMLAKRVGGKQLILQHRQELVSQNMEKFLKINPGRHLSLYTANNKNMRGETVFAMQQTLCNSLDAIGNFDLCVVDETHHIIAPTYQRIIDRVRERNPKCYLAGFTATPERGDRKSLRKYFDNVAEKISIRELVALGFLVPPRAFVIDTGIRQELDDTPVSRGFGDQVDIEQIMNRVAVNDEVVRHWKEKADGRQTIVFCSTVRHAQDVSESFRKANIRSECVHGNISQRERGRILRAFDSGEIQVVTNVAVLTEGYDSQPVSCVILLRQCSEKNAMIQMAGRGLRTVDPQIHPGVFKEDCIILDFGTSILTHGDLDMDDGLHIDRVPSGDPPVMKVCPNEFSPYLKYRYPDKFGNIGCGSEIPAATRICPLCGFVFERLVADGDVTEVDLTEVDILNASPFRYIDLFGTGNCLMAGGFAAWAGVFSPDKGRSWIALGKLNNDRLIHKLAITSKIQAIAAADDFMRNNETDGSAKKSKRWLNDPCTEKQAKLLNERFGYAIPVQALQLPFGGGPIASGGFTKYEAAIHLNFNFSRRGVEMALGIGE